MADQISAFPILSPVDETGRTAVGYPFPDSGMTLRDYFAAKALPLVMNIADLDNVGCVDVALAAYEWADAMLQAREVPPCV